MRYFLDTEFYEKPGSIELISIGICSDDGREYYAESSYFDWGPHNPALPIFNGDSWLWENVRPHIGPIESRKLPGTIALDIKEFVGKDSAPEFWGYFCDYDWVVFCWLFGRMIDLPHGFPMFCRDLKQVMWHLGLKKDEVLRQEEAEHNALADARWVREVFNSIYRHRVLGGGSGPSGSGPRLVRDVIAL